MERDLAERDSRDKETRILNASRQLEELQSHLAEVERQSQQQQAELAELMSSKDDVGKSVRVACRVFFSVGLNNSFLSRMTHAVLFYVIFKLLSVSF